MLAWPSRSWTTFVAVLARRRPSARIVPLAQRTGGHRDATTRIPIAYRICDRQWHGGTHAADISPAALWSVCRSYGNSVIIMRVVGSGAISAIILNLAVRASACCHGAEAAVVSC